MATVDINKVEGDFLVKVIAGESVERAKLRIFQFTNVRGALTTVAGVPPLDNEFITVAGAPYTFTPFPQQLQQQNGKLRCCFCIFVFKCCFEYENEFNVAYSFLYSSVVRIRK
jgi:hypothetical protein